MRGPKKFRSRGRVRNTWQRLEDAWLDFIAPLSTRERVVYSLLVLAGVSVFIAAPSRATVEDEGKTFQIAAQQCSSDEAWLNPTFSSGQPNLAVEGQANDITFANAARWQNRAGYLTCANFNTSALHTVTNPVLSLTLRGSSTTGQIPAATSTTIDGSLTSFEPMEVTPISSPLEPNALAAGSVALVDSFLEVEISENGGQSWRLLHQFNASILNLEQPTVHLALPQNTLIDNERFAVRLRTVSNIDAELLIDAINISYVVGRADNVSLSFELPNEDALPAFSREAFRFELASKDPVDGFWQGLGSQLRSGGPAIDVRADIIDPDGQTLVSTPLELEWQETAFDNRSLWDAKLNTDKLNIEPGRYQMRLTYTSDDGRSQVLTQDFMWGVLALNTNKTVYSPNEQGKVMLSVLDELGKTVCDSQLELEITAPGGAITSYRTDTGHLAPTDTCDVYGDHIQADYEIEHLFSDQGEYQLQLTSTTNNGTYSITDSVAVSDEIGLNIERRGPTRVYPIVSYPMILTVTAGPDGFIGSLSETVPEGFEISPSTTAISYDNLTAEPDRQLITWDITLSPGESVELGYAFDAPDISPEFYLLGPAQLQNQNTETVFEETRQWQLAGDAVGRMLLFFAGGTIPGGWTCVSCTSGDPFFQTFIRGNTAYGGTGGSLSHTHTASGSVAPTTTATTENFGSGNVDEVNHSHLFTPTLSTENNLPVYRQLRVIRSNTTGEPATIPTGAIAVFDTTVPSGWTQYSAQDGQFIYGENTVGATGGSNTHTTTISGSTSTASGATYTSRGGGTQTTGATAGHSHTVSGTSAPAGNVPPYIEVVLGQLNSAGAPVDGMIAMWDEDPAGGWDHLSSAAQPFHQRFILPSTSYGTTGGTDTHNHSDTTITSGVPSGTTAARQGTAGAGPAHTHQVSVTNYSTVNHLPPYRDVVFAKRDISAQFEQSAFRWYEGDNSTDVSTPLAAQDTAANAPDRGIGFRLRMNVHVSLDNLAQNGQNFKLQYAEMSGSCDVNFSGESYVDVATASGGIRYFNNTTPSDGNALTGNANDPVHSGHTTRNQTYEEANNFTNSQSAINNGEDGMWDFSLVDVAANELTTYCFRIVLSDDTPLDTYTVIPAITTAELPPRMILLYDGGSAPSGWTCISCSPGDPFYQRFVRGSSAFGTTGGAATHTHTASASVAATASAGIGRSDAGTALSAQDHAHTFTPTIDPASSLPAYRQLKIIRYENGTPATIPAGAIALFDTAVPAGWTRYSAQDGQFVRGENTAGTTGGSNTHSHTISGTLDPATGTLYGSNGSGTQADVAAAAHTHDISGSSDSIDNQPPFIETYLGQANSDTSVVGSMIALWDKDPNGTWTCLSCTGGDPFFERFFKPANGYGTTGGALTHTHGNSVIATGGPSATLTTRNQQTNVASNTHTHSVTISSFSTDNHLPPYTNVIVAQAASTNTAPDAPTNLAQEKTDTSNLGVGAFTNENTVVFSADLTDTDNPDNLQICVEVELIGTAFDDIDTQCGSPESFTGSTVTASVTVSSLADGSSYHWQARTKDGFGATSAWISFGANAESAADFTVDTSAPTGTVYDGPSVGVDIDFNGGSLDTLAGNWNINSDVSGLDFYEYSIGTSPGGTNIVGWTNNGTTTSFSETGLNLTTSQLYYINVRTTDNAGSSSVISSDGQFVSPTLAFSSSTNSVAFGNLNAANSFTATANSTLTTSTNAYNGYLIRAYLTALPTSGANTINLFNGGTYASPDEWLVGDRGYGYYTTDTLVDGVNRFNNNPCPGGGTPPCYAPFSLSAPGDIIADNASTISGTPIINEQFTVHQRVTVDDIFPPGTYRTTIIYSVTARY